MKNIAVHSRFRRRSMGRAMVLGAAAMARAAGNPRVCIFGVDGTVGEALYRACGFVEVGAQIEWTKRLDRSAG